MSKPKKTKKINLPFRVSALNVAVEDGVDGLAEAFCETFLKSPPPRLVTNGGPVDAAL